MQWIDVHTHLNMLEFPVEEALLRASAAGVKRCITIGTSPEDWPTVSAIAEKYFPQVACFIGLHPHDANQWNADTEGQLRNYLTKPWVLGVGEIGLDYFYKNSDINQQQLAFRRQMEIAEELKLPVEIHTRDADSETIEYLREFSKRVRGLLHCFSGTRELAEAAVKYGYHFSISGILTFKNAESLRETVKAIPLEHLHVETDAPFLAPVPMRGKKNEPAFMPHTSEFLAKLKGIPLKQLNEQAWRNAQNLFQPWALPNPDPAA